MTESEALGQIVRRERKRLGLSQEELAEESGIHRNFVGLIERGERSASIETVFKLARGLGFKGSKLVRLVEAELERS